MSCGANHSLNETPFEMTTTDTQSLPRPAMLITGAAHRIGRQLALSFAQKGWARHPLQQLARTC